MKKGVLGEGMMNVISLLVLVGILVVFFIIFTKNIDYSNLKNVEEIISSKKINSDGGITLKNLLNTPLENVNLYEFIILNKNDQEKIKNKVNELMKDICNFDKILFILEPEKICSWNMKIKFSDETINLEGGFAKSSEAKASGISQQDSTNKFSYNLNLPDYNNNLVNIELGFIKGT